MGSMRKGRQELLVIGDRVLVKAVEGEVRTRVGLILPPGALERETVQSGKVTALGPGIALPPPDQDQEEPWKTQVGTGRFMPMQVRIGDFAVFFRKAAIEITFQDERYLVVPQSAILVVVRENEIPDVLPDDI